MSWKPTASLEMLRRRAFLLKEIRQYFDENGVLEVVTPILSCSATTDPNIESLATDLDDQLAGSNTRYLHTSPEFPMKRLLCAGVGDIYQICTVFRQGESGRHHNPEFQMLEYYREGFDHHRLMDDLQQLVSRIWTSHKPDSEQPAFHRVSYREALFEVTGAGLGELDSSRVAAALDHHAIDAPLSLDDPLDSWLDLLMGTVVAKSFDPQGMTFLHGYPESQAALARIQPDETGEAVAARFELYAGELELANGFYELANAEEQRLRFESDQAQRLEQAKTTVPYDQNLIAALDAGLPDCAGVAMGLDRLLMLLSGADHLEEVLAFPSAIA